MHENISICTGCAMANAGVSRREFVSQATLAAVALALSGCGGGSTAGPSAPGVVSKPPTIVTPLVITLASFPALASVGGVARVSSQPPLALARTNSGLVGFSLECTHAGTLVDIRGDSTLRCPNHGAEFAFDGTFTGGTQQTSSLFRVTVTPDSSGATVSITT
jgi:nitrite reductase/ring-hydroxylating ferredoxin subunit